MATIYTGHSCPGGQGAGAWAALVAGDRLVRSLSGYEARAGDERLELLATLAGLRALAAAGEAGAVLVVTRHQNLCRALAGQLARWRAADWRTASGRPVANWDLWEQLAVLADRQPVRGALRRDFGGPDLTGQARQLAADAARQGPCPAGEPGPVPAV